MRRSSLRNSTALIAGLIGLGILGSACSVSPSSSPPSTTVPPKPNAVVGFVTLIGSGPNLGSGAQVAALSLQPRSSAIAKIGVGAFPSAIAIVPSPGDLALVANYAANTVSLINLRTGKLVPFPTHPRFGVLKVESLEMEVLIKSLSG